MPLRFFLTILNNLTTKTKAVLFSRPTSEQRFSPPKNFFWVTLRKSGEQRSWPNLLNLVFVNVMERRCFDWKDRNKLNRESNLGVSSLGISAPYKYNTTLVFWRIKMHFLITRHVYSKSDTHLEGNPFQRC